MKKMLTYKLETIHEYIKIQSPNSIFLRKGTKSDKVILMTDIFGEHHPTVKELFFNGLKASEIGENKSYLENYVLTEAKNGVRVYGHEDPKNPYYSTFSISISAMNKIKSFAEKFLDNLPALELISGNGKLTTMNKPALEFLKWKNTDEYEPALRLDLYALGESNLRIEVLGQGEVISPQKGKYVIRWFLMQSTLSPEFNILDEGTGKILANYKFKNVNAKLVYPRGILPWEEIKEEKKATN